MQQAIEKVLKNLHINDDEEETINTVEDNEDKLLSRIIRFRHAFPMFPKPDNEMI